MKYFLQFSMAILLLLLTGFVHASPIYSYSIDNPHGSSAGGNIANITTSYNTNNSVFSWEYTIENENDGFWLVVSDGPNPKGTINQLAILYGDLDNNLLTAYQYNGQNNSNSYNTPGNMLQQWSGALSTVNVGTDYETTSFSIDVGAINAANISPTWEGIQFGEQLGIWLHPSKNSTFTYNQAGEIIGYSRIAGWHDSRNNQTTQISEPGILLLLVFGTLGLLFFRRQPLN